MVAIDRASRFSALPQPLQVAYVRAWEAYRQEFGVPRGSWQVGSRRSKETCSGLALPFNNYGATLEQLGSAAHAGRIRDSH